MALNWKLLIKSIIIFLVSYYSLIGISFIPSVQEALHSKFSSRTEKILSSTFPKARFVSDPSTISNRDYKRIKIIFAYKEAARNAARLASFDEASAAANLKYGNLSLFVEGVFVFPFVLFIALLLATPGMKLSTRALALLIGYILISFYIFANVSIKTSFMLQEQPIGVYQLSNFWKGIVSTVAPLINMGISISIVVLIWVLVAFRKNQFQSLLFLK